MDAPLEITIYDEGKLAYRSSRGGAAGPAHSGSAGIAGALGKVTGVLNAGVTAEAKTILGSANEV
jgi:hypothetical protein